MAHPMVLRQSLRLMADGSKANYLSREVRKQGLGTRYYSLNGYWHVLTNIFEMDADFSHDPNDLPRLYSACKEDGYDLSVGSRYSTGVNAVNWPMGRVPMSYFRPKYVRFITRFHKIQQRKLPQRGAGNHRSDEVKFKGYAFRSRAKYTLLGFKLKGLCYLCQPSARYIKDGYQYFW